MAGRVEIIKVSREASSRRPSSFKMTMARLDGQLQVPAPMAHVFQGNTFLFVTELVLVAKVDVLPSPAGKRA